MVVVVVVEVVYDKLKHVVSVWHEGREPAVKPSCPKHAETHGWSDVTFSSWLQHKLDLQANYIHVSFI